MLAMQTNDMDANLLGFSCIIDRSTDKLLIKNNIVSQVKIIKEENTNGL